MRKNGSLLATRQALCFFAFFRQAKASALLLCPIPASDLPLLA